MKLLGALFLLGVVEMTSGLLGVQWKCIESKEACDGEIDAQFGSLVPSHEENVSGAVSARDFLIYLRIGCPLI